MAFIRLLLFEIWSSSQIESHFLVKRNKELKSIKHENPTIDFFWNVKLIAFLLDVHLVFWEYALLFVSSYGFEKWTRNMIYRKINAL